MRFFPFAERQIEPSGAADAGARRRRDSRADAAGRQPARAGTRAASPACSTARPASLGGARRAATIDVPLAGSVVAGPKPRWPRRRSSTLRRAGARPRCRSRLRSRFAFVGGMLLNLMPCVFPVLSIKVLGFATQAARRPATLRRAGAGLRRAASCSPSSRWRLALLALRAAGEQLGWGFQLQSPAVVAALALLFFAARR